MPNTRFKLKTTVRIRFLASLLMFALASPPLGYAQQPQQRPPAAQQRIITEDEQKTKTSKPSGPRAARPELVLQTGVTQPAYNAIFSPDGRLLASIDQKEGSIKLWEIATGRELYTIDLGAHDKKSYTMSSAFAFNSDGSSLFSFADGKLKQWDTRSGRQLRSTDLYTGNNSVYFSADARLLATSAIDGLSVRDVTSGQTLQALNLDNYNQLVALAISPDGKMLATNINSYPRGAKGMRQDLLTLRDATSGRVIQTIKISEQKWEPTMAMSSAFNSPMRSIRFSLDGRALAVAFHDMTYDNSQLLSNGPSRITRRVNKIRIWDVSSGSEMTSLDAGAQGAGTFNPDFYFGGTNTFAISNDNQRCALAIGNTIKLFDPAARRNLATISGYNREVRAVNFSADGKLLVTVSDDNTIKIWDVSTAPITGRVELARTMGVIAVPVESVAFTGDGRAIAVSSVNTVNIWELNTGAALRKITRPAVARDTDDLIEPSRSVFSAGGRFIAAQSGANEIKLWETGAGREVKSFPLSRGSKFVGAGVSADGAKVILAERQSNISSVTGTALSDSTGDSKTLTALRRVNIKLWDTNVPGDARSLSENTELGFSNIGLAFSFSDDGSLLASVTRGPSIKIIEVASGREISTISLSDIYYVDSLAWSADGRLLASSSRSGGNIDAAAGVSTLFSETIKLWDPATGRELRTMTGHTAGVRAMAFSSDSRLLASGGNDAVVKLWDTATGREIMTLDGHSLRVSALAFSPDGKLLVSGSDDGSARLWDVKSGEPLATLVTTGGGADWLVVTPDGLFDGTPGAWGQILWRFSADNIFDVAPVEIFFDEFFYPGLLSDIATGKRPRAAKDVGQKDRRQPVLNLARADGQSAAGRAVKVKIDISEPASVGQANPAGARDVRLFRNGTLVKFWRGDALKGQKQATLEAEVTIVAGENRLVAYAFNRDGVKSSDALLTVTGADSLRRKGVAYVIACGVNQYANAQYNLKYAVADATSFAEELRAQQLKLQEYERVEVIPLLDSEATKANILLALNRLSNAQAALPAGAPAALSKIQPAQPEDAVLIFFAGHGAAQGARFYLIPHDLGYAGARNALNAQAVQTILSRSVSDLELEAALEGVDAGRLLFVLDACNSGQALEAEEKRRGPMNSTGLAQLAYEKGMYILTAAQSYQAALEAAQLGHGYLTFALIEDGLKKGLADRDPKDGQALAREWFNYAEERVPQMQEREMQTRLLLDFAENDAKAKNSQQRSIQRPRVFYRRELETRPFIVARP